jgi:hypothetical protein
MPNAHHRAVTMHYPRACVGRWRLHGLQGWVYDIWSDARAKYRTLLGPNIAFPARLGPVDKLPHSVRQTVEYMPPTNNLNTLNNGSVRMQIIQLVMVLDNDHSSTTPNENSLSPSRLSVMRYHVPRDVDIGGLCALLTCVACIYVEIPFE